MSTETILLILVVVAGFYMAWSIGANDVANAMGTSVGSGALTLRKAVFIAAILEFSGAFFFGSHVSETIQHKIIDSSAFASAPLLLACGMLSALIGAGIWMQIATYFGWPVSTTHSIIGAVVGFGIVGGGLEAVYWENVFTIAFSWILSPLLGGLLGFLLFSLLRQVVFFSPNPALAAKRIAPVFVFIVSLILSLIIFLDGIERLSLDLSTHKGVILSLALSAFMSFLSYVYIHYKLPNISSVALAPLSGEDEESLAATHAEYALVEKIFAKLQIMTACMMAFAHGANDVANAIGPLSAAIMLIRYNTVTAIQPIPSWVLAIGGAGIVVGLATWGWRVIETIGKKITLLTPTRGFTAEFGAAAVIAVASRLGMPISTTHTLVGAVIGVGLARGIGSLDMSTTRNILISWFITVPTGAVLAIITYFVLVKIFALQS